MAKKKKGLTLSQVYVRAFIVFIVSLLLMVLLLVMGGELFRSTGQMTLRDNVAMICLMAAFASFLTILAAAFVFLCRVLFPPAVPRLAARFALLGNPKGMSKAVVLKTLGTFHAWSELPEGGELLQWSHSEGPGVKFRVQLVFQDDVCQAVKYVGRD